MLSLCSKNMSFMIDLFIWLVCVLLFDSLVYWYIYIYMCIYYIVVGVGLCGSFVFCS